MCKAKLVKIFIGHHTIVYKEKLHATLDGCKTAALINYPDKSMTRKNFSESAVHVVTYFRA